MISTQKIVRNCLFLVLLLHIKSSTGIDCFRCAVSPNSDDQCSCKSNPKRTCNLTQGEISVVKYCWISVKAGGNFGRQSAPPFLLKNFEKSSVCKLAPPKTKEGLEDTIILGCLCDTDFCNNVTIPLETSPDPAPPVPPNNQQKSATIQVQTSNWLMMTWLSYFVYLLQ